MTDRADDNPFESYDLDPTAGPQAITARLRELAEEADDERERARIREAWEALTMHPRRRLDLALRAHPDSRPTVGRPPRPSRLAEAPPLTLADLVPLPSLARQVGLDEVAPGDTALERDPILNPELSAGSSQPTQT